MKVSTSEAIFLLFHAILQLPIPTCNAVLTGFERKEITNDKRYGCSWQGGTESGLDCNCWEDAEEMYITENLISSYDTSLIRISNCKKVRFGPKSIAEMRNLRRIQLRNIPNLEFEESSLIWYGYRDKDHYEERYDMSIPSLKIYVENCNISRIASYTFEGRINTIVFSGVDVQNIEPFAFTALMQTQIVAFKHSQLHNIRLQSLKKFNTERLELDGVKIEMIPSRFISNVTVFEDFIIKNCTFDTVRSGAFLVNNPKKFEVTDTRIRHLDGEAFKVITRGDVLFKNNVFDSINDGAFRAITLNRDESRGGGFSSIIFDSNVFTQLTRNSLLVSEQDFIPKFINLNINKQCDCEDIDQHIQDSAFYSEIKCLHAGAFVTVKEYKSNACSIIQSYSTPIIIVAVVLTLAFIVGVALFVYYKRVYLSKKYGSEKAPQNGNLSLIVPDGRTYRETELHVIVERADLLTTDL